MKPAVSRPWSGALPRIAPAAGLILALLVIGLAAGELIRAADSFRPVFTPLGQALSGRPGAAERFITRWGLTALELILAALLAAAGLILGLRANFSASPGRLEHALASVRSRLGWWSALPLLIIASYPAFLLLETFWGDVFSGAFVRLALLLSTAVVCGALLEPGAEGPSAAVRLVDGRRFLFGAALVAALHLAAAQLFTVTNYPFALTWSEGNRLYEYSIPFIGGRYDYPGELTAIRSATGRFWLWGLPFLIPDAPIWVHRLWNALLSTLPHLALGALLAHRMPLSRLERRLFTLWAFLFLAQGPIYTPLILSALALIAIARPGMASWQRFFVLPAAAAAAGYYASLSRWIWLPAIPAWAAFLMLEDENGAPAGLKSLFTRDGLRRALPAGLIAAAGLVGGMLANPKLLQPQRLSQSTALAQPLLWNRLLPNATYAEGVLAALIIATAPAIMLLGWLAFSRRWKLTALQAAVYTAAAAVFLVGGIVASVKIGGGNNLHNLDMFLVSLVILAGMALRRARIAGSPALIRLALIAAVLIPAWTAIRSGAPLKLPPAESTRKALESIRSLASEAAAGGEVLFIDQRQLLTFQEVRGVALVPEYEKKYMMDQAMAGNAAYFEAFYQDLKAKRFSLIVSDMLFNLVKNSDYAFSEENNAWVRWVSQPLLCYYTPLRTMQNVDIQLLVPNPAAQDCPTP